VNSSNSIIFFLFIFVYIKSDIYYMFSSDNSIVMIMGILMGLGFIAGSVYWVNKMFASSTKDMLVRFVLVVRQEGRVD